jgi:DNA-binding transcriptional MocR family regulator
MVKPIVSLLRRLRNYIVARTHIGHLHPGDQLPSYRTLSERWDIDHRMIARAYRALAAEGLVEVRGRAGVFLKEQEHIGGQVTVVCVDLRFGDRLRMIAGPEYEDRIHVVLATDKKAVRNLDPDQPALISTAARAQIDRGLTSIMKDVPAFSPESAAELAFLLIRLNLESTGSAKSVVK